MLSHELDAEVSPNVADALAVPQRVIGFQGETRDGQDLRIRRCVRVQESVGNVVMVEL